MITERPAIDWLTLTTFDLKTTQNIGRWVVGNCKIEDRESKHGNYMGSRGKGFFYGTAPQNGKDHYLLALSGETSDRFMFDGLRPGDLDCTRIDLQLTLPTSYSPRELYILYRELVDVLDMHETARGQRARSIDPIVPPDGMCTIYLGNRQSERFYRIYVKENDEQLFIRFEAEFKDKSGMAGKLYRQIGHDPLSMVNYLKGELDTLPNHELINPFKERLSGVPAEIMKGERNRPDDNKTLRWLATQVMPAFKRVMGNEDTRFTAFHLLEDLTNYANAIQKAVEYDLK